MLFPAVALALLATLVGSSVLVEAFLGAPRSDRRRVLSLASTDSAQEKAKLTLFISGPSIGNAVFRAELKKELTFFRGVGLLSTSCESH